MGLILNTSTIIRNLSIGPLSGGGNGGGGGSSEPSYLAVGAQQANSYTGAAYIFDAANYSSTPTELLPPTSGESFGNALAIHGNQIAIGASYASNVGNTGGAVYVYDGTNLSASPTRLNPSGLSDSDRFGSSIAINGTYLAVGAILDDDQDNNAGAVYVYDATNLSNTPTKLAPTGLDDSDYFGQSVAITSNQIIVGAFFDDDQGENAGAVYVYDANNLSTTPTKLAPSGLDTIDNFGLSVAATSNLIVVGARGDDDIDGDTGAVYVYDATNLSATPTKLAPTGLGQSDYFGNKVAATTNHIVISAHNKDDVAFDAGAVYVYDANNLSAAPTKLTPSGIGESDNFGYSVAAHGNQIAVGARQDDDQGSNAGAVYVYDASNLSATPIKLAPSALDVNYKFGDTVSLG